uniref:Transposon protein, putative, unclassified n=2 Tax=Oryza sativa subsp. japonica TaxID=39947 RepID=Q94GI6_ORYSJ|nr:hypothetical protein [Oryza sativa Japonica Group]ABF99202.1 transposon protein, putative, unclassified [Oryza sativa Japonica Group]
MEVRRRAVASESGRRRRQAYGEQRRQSGRRQLATGRLLALLPEAKGRRWSEEGERKATVSGRALGDGRRRGASSSASGRGRGGRRVPGVLRHTPTHAPVPSVFGDGRRRQEQWDGGNGVVEARSKTRLIGMGRDLSLGFIGWGRRFGGGTDIGRLRVQGWRAGAVKNAAGAHGRQRRSSSGGKKEKGRVERRGSTMPFWGGREGWERELWLHVLDASAQRWGQAAGRHGRLRGAGCQG